MERVVDGVVSLEAFPHGFSMDAETPSDGDPKSKTGASDDVEAMQGFIRVRKLPVLTERGMGIGGGDEMVFAMSKRRFVIKPFNLPPLDMGDGGGAAAGGAQEKSKEKELEF
jgi:elongator complex protein 4